MMRDSFFRKSPALSSLFICRAQAMYQYDSTDQQIIRERVAQFRDQTRRHLEGQLELDHYRPLRLQNGLYVQRHAPMLRIAVPYGMVNSRQLRALAKIARHYDKGYLHFTTRQNVQINWPSLDEVPDILEDLAAVEMHAVQTSGNCIRNTTTDPFAGIAQDEIVDPRPYCEIIRQWSTFHPEFAFLPRKFKIAVSGTTEDRAAIRAHDIGLQILKRNNEIGFKVFVGGGLGRTPVVGVPIHDFVDEKHLLTYLEAIMRVYNLLGRRDNKYKARIKILVRALGSNVFAEKVEEEWRHTKNNSLTLTQVEIDRVSKYFTAPDYQAFDALAAQRDLQKTFDNNPSFHHWYIKNTVAHRVAGYRAVVISLKPTGVAPGDVTDIQMESLADLADEYSFGELRSTHQQNVVLADVPCQRLFELWKKLNTSLFATPNYGMLTDMICCPGGDFCSLANAKSIPVAEAIQRKFDHPEKLGLIGKIDVNISGCMNACGHHHVGHIGILGVDKKGEEYYQISVGGDSSYDTAIGEILGPSFSRDAVPGIMEKLLDVYLQQRQGQEIFIETYRRIGINSFRAAVYGE
jgi:sulfite reductase (NADPH) hemoprotein beta-component